MSNNIQAEELLKLAFLIANTKEEISFEELNSILFPTEWKEIEKLYFMHDVRCANCESDCYCE